MTTTPAVIRAAGRDEYPLSVALLAEAFANDPLITAATAAANMPGAARRRIFEASLRSTVAQGGAVLVGTRGDAIIGVALVVDPPRGRMRTALHRVRAALRFLRLIPFLGHTGLTLLNKADLVSRRFAPNIPHHVLTAVGVAAREQGTGVGRLLVNAAVERMTGDPRSGGLRLETENPDNVPRYERWGFRLLGQEARTPITVFVMFQSRPTDKESARGRTGT